MERYREGDDEDTLSCGEIDERWKMAAATLVTLPIIVLFFLCFSDILWKGLP